MPPVPRLVTPPGLEGVEVMRTAISRVQGSSGRLTYRGGYDVKDIWRRSYEDVVTLLHLGSMDGPWVSRVRAIMARHRGLEPAALATLVAMPPDADPMLALQAVLTTHAASRPIGREVADAVALTSVASTAAAAVIRHLSGLAVIEPSQTLPHVANFLTMLGVDDVPKVSEWTEPYFAIMADHELPPSTFTACVVASTGATLASACVAAIGALSGPLHGGALTEVATMLDEASRAEDLQAWVATQRLARRRYMGFGHREYRTYDPRARILREICRQANPQFYDIASRVEQLVLEELESAGGGRVNSTNVDFYATGVLQSAGIDRRFLPCVFAAARMAGWSAHVLEYWADDGRMISPVATWAGPEVSR